VDRRAFVSGAVSVLATPLAAPAQQAGTIPRIAVVLSTSPVTEMLGPDPVHPHVRAFLQALRVLGYVEGQNIVIERRSAEGRLDRLPELFAELVQAKCDVIVAATLSNPGCQAGHPHDPDRHARGRGRSRRDRIRGESRPTGRQSHWIGR
jgi:putative ABC transport system substrate-binding protein